MRTDFDAVNGILAGTFTGVIRDLETVSRWSNTAVAFGGGRLFNFSLHVARSQAWDAAERLYPLNADGRTGYVGELDEMVSVLAYLITAAVIPDQLRRPARSQTRAARSEGGDEGAPRREVDDSPLRHTVVHA